MLISDSRRIVFEQVSLSHRRYHVNAEFSCELEHGIVMQHLTDALQNAQPTEEQMSQLFEFMNQHSRCSLAKALNELDCCDHGHSGEAGIVDVTINLARADWSIMHRKVIKLISTNLRWNEGVEVDAAK